MRPNVVLLYYRVSNTNTFCLNKIYIFVIFFSIFVVCKYTKSPIHIITAYKQGQHISLSICRRIDSLETLSWHAFVQTYIHTLSTHTNQRYNNKGCKCSMKTFVVSVSNFTQQMAEAFALATLGQIFFVWVLMHFVSEINRLAKQRFSVDSGIMSFEKEASALRPTVAK